MTTEVAKLVVKVGEEGVTSTSSALSGLTGESKRAESATGGLMQMFKRFAGPVAGLVSATAAMRKLVSTAQQVEILEAALKTATGSAEGATQAFAALEKFALTTPYGLEDSTQAFIKLVNMGLNPSERALTSYGNTAAAMGRDLESMVDAVANASVGNFMSLRQFGIRAQVEGDNVAMTFRGVTTEVANNAQAIEEYLLRLGEVEFAGAMADRAATVDGALAELGDAWDSLFDRINKAGVGDAMRKGIETATEALVELRDMIESGQLTGYFQAWIGQFDGFISDFEISAGYIADLWRQLTGNLQINWGAAVDWIIDAFKYFPANLRATIQLAAVELFVLVDLGGIYGKAFVDSFVFHLEGLVKKAGAYAKAIGQALNPFSDGSFDLEAELERIGQSVAAASDVVFSKARQQADIVRDVRISMIEDILTEHTAAVTSFDDQIDKAKELRAEFEKNKAALANAGDQLSEFHVIPPAAAEDVRKLTKEQQRALDQVREALRTDEESIREAYERRNQIILESMEEGSEAQLELQRRNQEKMAEELYELQKRAMSREELLWRTSWEGKATVVAGVFNNLTNLMNSKSRGMFEIGKAAAISETIVATYASATSAYKALAGIPIVGPALGAAAAAAAVASGLVNVQRIKSTSFGGAGAGGAQGVYPTSISGNPAGTPGGPPGADMFPSQGQAAPSGPTFIFHGDFYGNDAEKLFYEFKNLISNGDHVLVESTSRNGRELVA